MISPAAALLNIHLSQSGNDPEMDCRAWDLAFMVVGVLSVILGAALIALCILT